MEILLKNYRGLQKRYAFEDLYDFPFLEDMFIFFRTNYETAALMLLLLLHLNFSILRAKCSSFCLFILKFSMNQNPKTIESCTEKSCSPPALSMVDSPPTRGFRYY